jgi:hypothetical protein
MKTENDKKSSARQPNEELRPEDDAERDIAEFERLSGQGNSKEDRFDRDEIHER